MEESHLRRVLYEHTGGMFPELVTRADLEIFLPPINGLTIYMVGDVATIPDPDAPLVVRRPPAGRERVGERGREVEGV